MITSIGKSIFGTLTEEGRSVFSSLTESGEYIVSSESITTVNAVPFECSCENNVPITTTENYISSPVLAIEVQLDTHSVLAGTNVDATTTSAFCQNNVPSVSADSFICPVLESTVYSQSPSISVESIVVSPVNETSTTNNLPIVYADSFICPASEIITTNPVPTISASSVASVSVQTITTSAYIENVGVSQNINSNVIYVDFQVHNPSITAQAYLYLQSFQINSECGQVYVFSPKVFEYASVYVNTHIDISKEIITSKEYKITGEVKEPIKVSTSQSIGKESKISSSISKETTIKQRYTFNVSAQTREVA